MALTPLILPAPGGEAAAAALAPALSASIARVESRRFPDGEIDIKVYDDIREAIEPHVIRAPRRALPIMQPPTEGEAGRRAASSLLSALLPMPERVMVELSLTGERVLTLWTSDMTGL